MDQTQISNNKNKKKDNIGQPPLTNYMNTKAPKAADNQTL